MLIEHLVDVGGAERAKTLELGDLDAFYKAANLKFDAGGDFQDRARRRVVLLQQRDPETIALWQALVGQSAQHWNEVYVEARRAADRRRHRGGEPLRGADAGGRRSAGGRRPAAGVRRRAGRVPARVRQPRERAAAAHRAQPRRRLHVRDVGSGVRRRSRRAGQGDVDAVRRRRAAGAALRDGLQGGRDGRVGWSRRTAPSTSRSAASSGPTASRSRAAAASRSASSTSSTRRSIAAAPPSPRRTRSSRPSSARWSASRSASAR